MKSGGSSQLCHKLLRFIEFYHARIGWLSETAMAKVKTARN